MEKGYGKKKKIWLISSFLFSCITIGIGAFWAVLFPSILFLLMPFFAVIVISLFTHLMMIMGKSKLTVVLTSFVYIIASFCFLPIGSDLKWIVILISCVIGWGHYGITFFLPF